MGYSPEHRQATRRRILDAAGDRFRREGFAGARIDEIMGDAGLTRGGFYLHFKSKEDLFAAVMGDELEFARRLREMGATTPSDPAEGALRAVAYYLDPANRNKIARGCTIVSNAADMSRAKPAARRAFSRSYDGLVAEFEEVAALAPSSNKSSPARARALAALATCVGAVVLARALMGEERIRELLEASRVCVFQLLSGAKRKA